MEYKENNIVVIKFGGEALSNNQRIKAASEIIISHVKKGEKPVVVVSAMAGITDKLISYVSDVNPSYSLSPSNLEMYDTVAASGEQITTGLVALCLSSYGYYSKPLLGWQVPIYTDNNHSFAQIKKIENEKILEIIKDNGIPVIAGFQGVSEKKEVTTLGRGGTDTTAVAVAASLGAKSCYFYKDVDGLYTADPKLVSKPKKIQNIDYETLIEITNSGAKILHNRAVGLAMKYSIKLHIVSFNKPENLGTIVSRENKNLEESYVSSIILESGDYTKIEINNNFTDQSFIYTLICGLEENNVTIDNFNYTEKVVSFSIKSAQEELAVKYLNSIGIENSNISSFSNLKKVSLVGLGLVKTNYVLRNLFIIFNKNDISLSLISCSDIKISVLINNSLSGQVSEQLHDFYIK